MQNAKRNSCKNNPVQTVDGSTANHLSTDENASQQERPSANENESHVQSGDEINDDDDDDDNDSFNWYSTNVVPNLFYLFQFPNIFIKLIYRQKTSQNLCEVEIKDESSSNVGGGSNFEKLAPNDDDSGAEKSSKKQKRNNKSSINDDRSFSSFYNNPLTTSFDVLNLLRNSSSVLGKKYTDEIQLIVDMHAKEHSLRMTILQTQLETAQLNRDIAEINKIFLLRNLQNIHD